MPPCICSFVQQKNGERSVGNKAALFLLPPTPGAALNPATESTNEH